MVLKSVRKRAGIAANSSGQAIVEYMILVSAVALFFTFLSRWVSSSQLADKLTKPITGDFAHVYQLGDPKAKDFGEDGGPEKHARMDHCKDCFRIFLNPQL